MPGHTADAEKITAAEIAMAKMAVRAAEMELEIAAWNEPQAAVSDCAGPVVFVGFLNLII